MPGSCFARSRPSCCDWLKERSLNLPMSLTSATVVFEPAALPVVVVSLPPPPPPPPQPAAISTAAAPSAASGPFRNATTPIADVLPNRRAGPQARPSRTSASFRLRRELRRNLQLLLDDLGLVAVHQLDVRLRHGRVDLADAHALVLQVEEQVATLLEAAELGLLDGLVDPVADALDPGRHDSLGVLVLILVDPDAPDLGRSGRLQRAEAAATGNLEE